MSGLPPREAFQSGLSISDSKTAHSNLEPKSCSGVLMQHKHKWLQNIPRCEKIRHEGQNFRRYGFRFSFTATAAEWGCCWGLRPSLL